MELGEFPEETVIRELKEETGITYDYYELDPLYELKYYHNPSRWNKYMLHLRGNPILDISNWTPEYKFYDENASIGKIYKNIGNELRFGIKEDINAYVCVGKAKIILANFLALTFNASGVALNI